LDQTPWQGITRVIAGKMYINGGPTTDIDNIHNWITGPVHTNIDEAYEDFHCVWKLVTKTMTPTCQAGLTYSGGLDSSIILSHIDNLELYAVNNLGKDPRVDCIEDFLTSTEKTKLNVFSVDEMHWAAEYNQMLNQIYMPASSWSFVGQWIVNKNCKQRVLFTGVGADELFGGYDLYRDLKFNTAGSVSPYSQHGPMELWNRCLSSYNGHAGQATLLMDYWHQVAGVDARGIDLIAGAWGIEPRNPFLSKPVMQLALNLPFEFKVNTVSKPLIRRAFLDRWNESLILPKKGFTGHANDSLPYMNFKFDSTGDRMEDWKIIAQKSFYDCKHN
jgi:asparagine synthetase B (glutamine-hydrolysing)